MSWLKKAIVGVSVASLAAPIVANGAIGTVIAATSGNNAKTETVAKPNSSYKVPFRDANSLFNLKLDKQKNGYVLVTSIAASGNNVIQKGEQLVVHLSKQNVDLNNSSIVNQNGSLPYTVKKDADKGTVTFTFNQNVDSGNYQTAVGIATKNLYTSTPVKANFEGASIKIKDNMITSKWQPQTTTSSTNSTNSTVAQQGANSYTSQSTVTQAASSNTTASTSYTTTSSTTYQQAGTTTTQTQANESNAYQPTFDEAEKAVMGRTNISVAGDASNTTETSANKVTTNNGSSSVEANNALPESSTNATTENSSSSEANATNDNEATDVQADKTDSDTQVAPSNTGAASQATANEQTAATTTQPANKTELTAPIYQADSSSSNVVRTPDGKASDPKATLNEVLKNNDTDPNNADNTGDTQSYQPNSTFEGIRKDIENKVPTASAEEQAEIVKTMPFIWSYISNSADQNQVFNFSTLLSTGRTAYTTINGVADSNSSNILQQQMPTLLKAFGSNMTDDAFDKAMDIDVLLESQVYKDYLAGKYTVNSDKLDASDAWSAMNDHITVTKVDDSTDTAGATKLENRYYNAKATLDGLVAAEVAKKQAEQADQLVVNKTTSENKADDQTPAATDEDSNATGSKLFSQMKNDIDYKMSGSSEQDRAAVLGALPGILNDVSKKTASSDTTGTVSKYLQPTADGNSYLITLDTQAIKGSSDKYLANLPQVFKAFGDSLKEGDFDKAISTTLMNNSQIYKDYLDGKYVPESLQVKKTVDNKDDLLPAILLAIVACPLLALGMGVVTILTSPIWVPLAIATWGIVFAITALPIGFIYTVLGALIIPSLIVFPIMLVVSLVAAPILLIANLIPIVNLITIPITLINLALTFIPGFIVLTYLPMTILAGAIVLGGLIIPAIMKLVLVAAQIIAGILSLLTGGLLAMLVPVTALLGLIIAGAFSLLALIGFPLIAALIIGGVLAAIVGLFAVLTVVAGGFSGVIGLGLIAGMAVVLLGYLAFNFGGMLAGIAVFLILLVLMPQFLVLNFLKWFVGFGFMALILTDLAIPSLYLAIAIGALMMLFFVPGLLIALSWPFWMGLVLAISIPIVEIAFVIALPFSFIPLFGWIADAIVGVIILIQAGALVLAITTPVVIGVCMMTIGIIGFDIAAAAAAVLDLIKKKQVAERIHVNIDPSWRLKIHPVGFWTKSDPLATALA